MPSVVNRALKRRGTPRYMHGIRAPTPRHKRDARPGVRVVAKQG